MDTSTSYAASDQRAVSANPDITARRSSPEEDSGGQRTAVIYTLFETAKLNDVDQRAWLADVLATIADHPARRLDELLPWNWKTARAKLAAAA